MHLVILQISRDCRKLLFEKGTGITSVTGVSENTSVCHWCLLHCQHHWRRWHHWHRWRHWHLWSGTTEIKNITVYSQDYQLHLQSSHQDHLLPIGETQLLAADQQFFVMFAIVWLPTATSQPLTSSIQDQTCHPFDPRNYIYLAQVPKDAFELPGNKS